jgi:hypothetical protein
MWFIATFLLLATIRLVFSSIIVCSVQLTTEVE